MNAQLTDPVAGDHIDLDRPVHDRIHLESLPGAVDRLLQQCQDIGAPLLTGIRRVADSVVADCAGPLREVAGLRLFSALSVVIGPDRDGDAADAVAALRHSREDGVLSALSDRPAFRVDPIGDRWQLRDTIEADLGWANDPADWQVNLTRRGELLLGQVGALHYGRRFPALARIPASTTPLVAAVMLALAKVRAGNVVYDPFCGAGTLLVETAAQAALARVLGSDHERRALTAAAQNRPLVPGAFLARADAAALPVATDSIDRIVSNLPFGKRVGSHAANEVLYPAFLRELDRVLRLDGRAVLLTEDKQLFRRSVEATPRIRLVREVPLATGGLHPTAYVLERTRAAQRSNRRAGKR
ncbi:MAG TPA: methyltransferase domain-containing protein [Pseudonocardiaceae bacterium]|jgi:SAM-dependent methyltransferase|nr:methyltransferase domain-containing protein [Pseudonocardiaceae bacterium]